MKEKQKEYNSALDLLRVTAMLMVFGVHFSQLDGIPSSLLFDKGAYGVQIFFALSGYLIFCSLDSGNTYKQYICKRLIRILPAYYFILILAFIYRNLLMHNMPNDLWRLGWIREILCLNTVIPSNDFAWNNLYGLWTISAFVFFYFVAPIMKKIINQSIHRCFFLVIFLFLCCKGTQFITTKLFFDVSIPIDKLDVLVGSSPINNLYAFAIGIIAYYSIKYEKREIGVLYLSFLMIIGLILDQEKILWSCLTTLIIIFSETFNKCIVKMSFFCRVLRIISDYSFCIYLSHLLVIDCVSNYLDVNSKYFEILIVLIFIFVISFMMKWLENAVKILILRYRHS